MSKVYAEDINYFQTSSTSPAVWLNRAADEVDAAGGEVLMQASGNDPQNGRAAYALVFQFGEDRFKVVWSALPLKRSTIKKERDAERQAATLLYHEVKSRCMVAKVKGFRQAFFAYWMLPDGRVAAEAAANEIMALETGFLRQGLIEGEVIDG